MKEFKIDINQETVNLLQSLHYECETRQNIIKFMLSNDNNNLNQVLFDRYHKELVEFTAQYDIAKQELQEVYIPKEFKDHRIDWTLDFSTNKLLIKLLCDCEVDI